MLDKSKLTGADIPVDFCKCCLQSPYILSSGLLCYEVEGTIKGREAGTDTVAIKTIRLEMATSSVYHMGTVNQGSLISCKKWTDSDRLNWYEDEAPKTVTTGTVITGSMGHTLREAQAIVKDVERTGAHVIELIPHTEDILIPTLDYTKTYVDIPVICKLSGSWPDTVGTARKCPKHGTSGIYATDSINPTLKIDIEKAALEMMSGDGFGWMTGAVTGPTAVCYSYQIAKENPQLMNLYIPGEVMKVDDVTEYMMAGAIGISVCTAGVLRDMEYVGKICYNLSGRLVELGYGSTQEISRTTCPNFPSEKHISGLKFHLIPSREDGITKKCVSCKKCETVYCYDARKLTFSEMTADMDKCRCRGLCLDVCFTGAFTVELAPQIEKGLALARKPKDFYELAKQRTLMVAALPDLVRGSIHI